jgi:hypothetical protein
MNRRRIRKGAIIAALVLAGGITIQAVRAFVLIEKEVEVAIIGVNQALLLCAIQAPRCAAARPCGPPCSCPCAHTTNVGDFSVDVNVKFTDSLGNPYGQIGRRLAPGETMSYDLPDTVLKAAEAQTLGGLNIITEAREAADPRREISDNPAPGPALCPSARPQVISTLELFEGETPEEVRTRFILLPSAQTSGN